MIKALIRRVIARVLMAGIAGAIVTTAATEQTAATAQAEQTAATAQAEQTAATAQAEQEPDNSATGRQIVVSLEDRKLILLEAGEVTKIYSVAVGAPGTPSPEGTFTIDRRVANPRYQHHGQTIDPGPDNPIGTRWMGLSVKGYGIHGTNLPSSIGKASSHGCIRMRKADLEEFYELVAVGDEVQIIGARSELTARLLEPMPNTTDHSATRLVTRAVTRSVTRAVTSYTDLAKAEPASSPTGPSTAPSAVPFGLSPGAANTADGSR